MSIISFRHKGDFAKVDKYFGKLKNVFKIDIFNRYGQKGVSALKSATLLILVKLRLRGFIK